MTVKLTYRAKYRSFPANLIRIYMAGSGADEQS